MDTCRIKALASPRVINFLSSLAPTLEGLWLMTVLDGKQGQVLFRFHAGVTREALTSLNSIALRYEAEFKPNFGDLDPERPSSSLGDALE